MAGWGSAGDLAALGFTARKWAVSAAWIVIVLLLGTLGAVAAVGFTRGMKGDFIHFHEAACAVTRGEDLYDSGSRGYIYPPLPAIVLTPLAFLPRLAAALVWTTVNLLLLVTGGWLLARETLRRLDPSAQWATACVLALGLLLNADKVRAVLSLGQTDVVTFFLLVVGLIWQGRRPLGGGLMLGLAFNIKYQAVLFLPYLLVRRRFLEASGMLAGAVGGLLAGGLVFGWHRNLDYLGRAFAGLLAMVGLQPEGGTAARIATITWVRSVSIPSAFARLGEHLGSPPLAGIASLLTVTATIALGWWLLWRWNVPLLAGRGGARESRPEWNVVVLLEWIGLVVGVLVFSPQTTVRHLFLLTFATIPAAALLLFPRSGGRRGALLAGVLVLAAGLSLPPGHQRLAGAASFWRTVGGPSWCALFCYFTVLGTGLAASRPRSLTTEGAGAKALDLRRSA